MTLQVSHVVALISTALLIFRFIVHPAFISPLAKIPNAHWSCSTSPVWLLWMKWTHQENQQVCRLHLSKGAAIRLAPNVVSVNSFEDGVKTIYQGGFPKPPGHYFNGFAVYGLGNLFTIEENDVHSARRKIISQTLSKTSVMSSLSLRAAIRDVLFHRVLPLMFDSARKGNALEMMELNYSYFLDSFTQWQFGRSLGSNLVEDIGERRLYLDGFFGISHYIFWQFQFPNLSNALRKVGVYLIPKWVDTGFQAVEDWNLRKCDQAQQRLASHQPLFPDDQPVVFESVFRVMSDRDSKAENYPQRLQIASEMFSLNSGAFETSGNTSTYLFYELCRRPEWQRKVREELLTLSQPPIYIPGKILDLENIVDPRELDALPILHAVIMETLRLWPIVPGGQPRMVPKPCTLGGYHNIPIGTVVQSYACVLHRKADVFPDPHSWKPERWLEATKEEQILMKRWFWGFGSGGRGCPGNHVAFYFIKFLFASVYTNFTTTIHDSGDMEPIDSYLSGPKGHRLEVAYHVIK